MTNTLKFWSRIFGTQHTQDQKTVACSAAWVLVHKQKWIKTSSEIWGKRTHTSDRSSYFSSFFPQLLVGNKPDKKCIKDQKLSRLSHKRLAPNIRGWTLTWDGSTIHLDLYVTKLNRNKSTCLYDKLVEFKVKKYMYPVLAKISNLIWGNKFIFYYFLFLWSDLDPDEQMKILLLGDLVTNGSRSINLRDEIVVHQQRLQRNRLLLQRKQKHFMDWRQFAVMVGVLPRN